MYPVKVVEGWSEFIHMLLANALSIAGEDLGLDLIYGSCDGGEQQLPSHTDVLLLWRNAHLKILWSYVVIFERQFISMHLYCSK